MIFELNNTAVITPPPPPLPPRPIIEDQKPSSFLTTPWYLNLALTTIQGIIRVEAASVDDNDKKLADKLGRVLKRRLSKHIKSKISDPLKHTHPALLFVRSNLNSFSALLYLFKQGRKSPVMHPNSCLLRQPNRGGFLVAVDRALEGSYLHWSNEESAWIRSGKAVGSDKSDPINGIVFRNETGHVKKAATASLLDGECFYTQYPSRDNNNQLPDKVGIFEDLTQYCVFSFNRSNNLSGLISTVDDEGLLDWSLYTSRFETTNIRGCSTFREAGSRE